jgi:hypothetical protein
MKTVEELFKQVNNDKIELGEHKDKLKRALLNSEYFSAKEKESWDWKLSLSSLVFSAIIIAFSVSFNQGGYDTTAAAPGAVHDSFYSKLSNNVNVSQVSSGSGENALQMVDDGTKTVFYFNERNVLVHSEVINNK